MRFTSTFLSLAQLIPIPSVLAIHPFVFPRNHSATQTLDHLQYRFPRSLIDTCVSLDVNTALNAVGDLPLAGPLLTPLIVSAITDLCLCLKDLDLYLKTDADIQVLAKLLGKDKVVNLLTAIVNTSPDSRQCVLPPHAKRLCDKSDPCHFECEGGFTRQGDVCICTPPKMVCNDACGAFPAGCAALPSSVPRSLEGISSTKSAQENTPCKTKITCSVSRGRGTLDCVETGLDGGCVFSRIIADLPNDWLANSLVDQHTSDACARPRSTDGFGANGKRGICGPSRTRVKKRRDLASTNAMVYTGLGLGYQLASLFNLGVKLKEDSSGIPTSDVTSVIGHHFTWSIVYPVLQSLSGVLTSRQVASLVANTNSLLDSVTTSSRKLVDCACVGTLKLEDLAADLNTMLALTINLTQRLAAEPVSPGSATRTVSSSGNIPIILNISSLLNQTGLGDTQTNVVIDGLGNDLSALVDVLLDGLGAGSNIASRPTNFDTGLALNLDTVLDLTLHLILDVGKFNMTTENPILKSYVDDIVKATCVLVACVINGQSVALELSSLADLAGAIKLIIDKPSQDRRWTMVAELDDIIRRLAMISGQPFSSSLEFDASIANVDRDSLLYNLEIKALRLYAVGKGRESTANFGLVLNVTVASRGL